MQLRILGEAGSSTPPVGIGLRKPVATVGRLVAQEYLILKFGINGTPIKLIARHWGGMKQGNQRLKL